MVKKYNKKTAKPRKNRVFLSRKNKKHKKRKNFQKHPDFLISL
jgi:hypothetical protein